MKFLKDIKKIKSEKLTIYHLLNTLELSQFKSNTRLAIKKYKENDRTAWIFKAHAKECLFTLADCKIITTKKAIEIAKHLERLTKLAKNKEVNKNETD